MRNFRHYIRSISNKIDSLNNLINTLNIPFQIIGLTETWLNENNKDCFIMNNYEYFGSNRLDKRGGSVCLYISKELECGIRNDLTKNIEIVKIMAKILLLELFIGHQIVILQHLKKRKLEKIDRENKLCYLMGDFNIDLFKSDYCDYASQFFEQLSTSFFLLITKATRITNHTETLIDKTFTNNLEKLNNSINGIVFSDISDHLPIVHMFNTNIFGKKLKHVRT